MGDKKRRKAKAGYARGSGGKFSAKDKRGRKRKAISTSSDISGVESRGVDEEVWCESAYDMDVCHVCETAGDEIADKYHCELNYIEVVWAYIRHRLRRDCDFNYEGMRRRLVELLDGGVPLEVFKRNSRFCFRFMDGYRRGLEGPLLDWANKRYSGKRCLPLSLTNEELTMKHEEYKRIKEEKKSKIARLKKK